MSQWNRRDVWAEHDEQRIRKMRIAVVVWTLLFTGISMAVSFAPLRAHVRAARAYVVSGAPSHDDVVRASSTGRFAQQPSS